MRVRRDAGRNRDRAFVLAAMKLLAAQGAAKWVHRGHGEVEFRLRGGETYVLGETSMTRIR